MPTIPQAFRWSLLAGLATCTLVTCTSSPDVPGLQCEGLRTGDFGDLQANDKTKGQLTSYLGAAVELDKLVGMLEHDLIKSCHDLGKAVGLDDAALDSDCSGDDCKGDGAKRVCEAVTARLESLARGTGDVKVVIEHLPPRCDTDIGVVETCFAKCDPAAKKPATCKGDAYGKCEGKCDGKCVQPAGSCSGSCVGTCRGTCNGKEAAKDDKGQPDFGPCPGKCQGQCAGECTIDIKGDAKAECPGACIGKCEKDMPTLRCNGDVLVAGANATCAATCPIQTASVFECHTPTLEIDVDGFTPGGEKPMDEDLKRIVDALKAKLPAVLEVQGRAAALAAHVDGLKKLQQPMGETASSFGSDPKIGECLAGANDLLGRSQATFALLREVATAFTTRAAVKGTVKKDVPDAASSAAPAAPGSSPAVPPTSAPSAAPSAGPSSSPSASPSSLPSSAPLAPPTPPKPDASAKTPAAKAAPPAAPPKPAP